MTLDLLNRCHDDAQELAVKLAKTEQMLINLYEAVSERDKSSAHEAYFKYMMARVAKELSQ